MSEHDPQASARQRGPKHPNPPEPATGGQPPAEEGSSARADGVDALSAVFSPRRLVARVAVLVVGLILVALAIRSLPGLADVRARLAAADGAGIVLVSALELGSVFGFVAALRGAFSNVPPWPVAVELGTAEQAANVLLPAGGVGGLALGAIVARDAGVPGEIAVTRTVALFLVTSGVTFAGIVLGGTLTALEPGNIPWYGSVAPAATALVLVLLIAALPRMPPAATEGWRRRLSTSSRDGITAALELVGEPNRTLLLGAVAYFAFDVAALAAAYHALGADVLPIGTFLLAYTLGQAGGLLPLPGGVGGVDGGLIAMFALYGAPLSDATAAVLAYRLFQLGVPVVCGLLGLAAYTRRRRKHRDVAAVAARYEGFDGGPR